MLGRCSLAGAVGTAGSTTDGLRSLVHAQASPATTTAAITARSIRRGDINQIKHEKPGRDPR